MYLCLYTLSNIAAGSDLQIESFLKHHDLIDKVFKLIENEEIKLKSEAFMVFCNFINTSHVSRFHHFIVSLDHYKLLFNFSEILRIGTPNLLLEVYDALEIILKLD